MFVQVLVYTGMDQNKSKPCAKCDNQWTKLVCSGFHQRFVEGYPCLVNLLKNYGKSPCLCANQRFLWPFSIVFCLFTRGYLVLSHPHISMYCWRRCSVWWLFVNHHDIIWGVWTPRQRDVTTKEPGRGEKIGGFPEIDVFKVNHAKLLFSIGKTSEHVEHVVFSREITRNWEIWSLVIPILSTISHVE